MEEKKKRKKFEILSRLGPRGRNSSVTVRDWLMPPGSEVFYDKAMRSELYWACWSSENGLYSTGNQWASYFYVDKKKEIPAAIFCRGFTGVTQSDLPEWWLVTIL